MVVKAYEKYMLAANSNDDSAIATCSTNSTQFALIKALEKLRTDSGAEVTLEQRVKQLTTRSTSSPAKWHFDLHDICLLSVHYFQSTYISPNQTLPLSPKPYPTIPKILTDDRKLR